MKILSLASALNFQYGKNENLQGRFRYVRSESNSKLTALTYSDGSVKNEISQGRIGTKIVPGTPSDKYLYDTYAYDSPLEKNNITSDIEGSCCFMGKFPELVLLFLRLQVECIVPTLCMFVKRSDGTKDLNIVVETKDVENKSDLRGTKKVKKLNVLKYFSICL